MNEHTGFHEYKDGKRFNPDCLACLKEEENRKKRLYEEAMVRVRDWEAKA